MIVGIILAAGLSSRMGTNKLMLPVGGLPAVERVIAAASRSKLDCITLVCSSEEVASIGGRYGIKIVYNTDPKQGQSKSIRLGIESSAQAADGYMFLVGDQPFISEKVINRLIESFKYKKCSAVVPIYKGERGNPVIFSSLLKDKLTGLRGDTGGRVLLKELGDKVATVVFDDGRPGFDIDTRDEYEALLKLEDGNE